jgi:molecular chaperone IbpA
MLMRRFDLTPLFRSTIGFDHLTRVVEAALQANEANLSYPPCNIEKLGEDSYRLTMAVAGFSQEDLDIITQEGLLVIRGRSNSSEDDKRVYLHRGIAGRAFERKFHLADFIRVAGAQLKDGLLHIDLLREVPEALRPRRIEIAANNDRPADRPLLGAA